MRGEELKVGVFDSGLGGLTVAKALLKHISGVDIVYVADTANAPYGEKSHDQIRQFSEKITNYLIENHHIDAVVVACNTATSAAISHLRQLHPDIPIIGTEPGIKPALGITHTHNVGILATPATLAGEKYQELADRLYNGTSTTLYEQACPGLVEQIESGDISSEDTRAMLEEWLVPMRNANVDTIVLGCTHYPLVGDMIRGVMGSDINLIETGEAIANRLKEVLDIEPKDILSHVTVYATDDINENVVGDILGGEISVEYL